MQDMKVEDETVTRFHVGTEQIVARTVMVDVGWFFVRWI
jgi:hypothetical protein